jgi:hypothetical protein
VQNRSIKPRLRGECNERLELREEGIDMGLDEIDALLSEIKKGFNIGATEEVNALNHDAIIDLGIQSPNDPDQDLVGVVNDGVVTITAVESTEAFRGEANFFDISDFSDVAGLQTRLLHNAANAIDVAPGYDTSFLETIELGDVGDIREALYVTVDESSGYILNNQPIGSEHSDPNDQIAFENETATFHGAGAAINSLGLIEGLPAIAESLAQEITASPDISPEQRTQLESAMSGTLEVIESDADAKLGAMVL